MYYIYHLPKIKKIGCTNNLKNRVEKQQGFKDYKILFKTASIEEASMKELELQKQYRYKVDSKQYKDLFIMKTKLYQTISTTTFVGTKDKNLTGYKLPDIITIEGDDIVLTEDIKDFIIKNNLKSQYSDERYVYNQTLSNLYRAGLDKTPEQQPTIYDLIRQWASHKGILTSGDTKTQYVKLLEETGELAKSILKNDREELIDAIGDCVVVLTNLAALEGLKIEDCVQTAYNVISKRTGKMENGTFVKDK